ncbi:pseudouridine-5'-phosphate glycosidase-like [Nilaparvata lugens]|uniref:pseudouridine-5'-phosphate glycosidase-like n=1 Tax=Nilaparvata lugens TaxID=108931 RepID=UPI00193EA811|nr:pseudouridine-5'-phosphate glycosidase-like [Nilaparvata lugens]
MDGGTTVAGTVLVAEKVGIKVFVTGGIGGVHRDVETSMDISADLMEMSRSSVTVVSSGIKSILDIGRTSSILSKKLLLDLYNVLMSNVLMSNVLMSNV